MMAILACPVLGGSQGLEALELKEPCVVGCSSFGGQDYESRILSFSVGLFSSADDGTCKQRSYG